MLFLFLFMVGSASATLDHVVTDPRGAQAHECPWRMAGHLTGSARINICLGGIGLFSGSAIDVARKTDWFPVSLYPLLATQVEEVRFSCNRETRARLILPTSSEAMKGRRARIDVPCRESAINLRADLRAIQAFIKTSLTDPVAIVRNTEGVVKACKDRPGSAVCKKWISFVSDILTGMSRDPALGRPLVACNVSFAVGLDGVAQNRRAGPEDPFAELDLAVSAGGIDPEKWEDMRMFLLEKAPHCDHVLGDDHFDFKKCSEELIALGALLARLHVDVSKIRGKIFPGGFTYDGNDDPKEALVLLWQNAMEQSALREANAMFLSPDWKDQQDEFNARANWDEGIEGFKIKGKVYRCDGATGGYTAQDWLDERNCGLDVDCNLVKIALREQLYRLVPPCEGQKGVPDSCYVIQDSTVTNGALNFAWEHVEDCPPKQ
jgi:hypothetical protein